MAARISAGKQTWVTTVDGVDLSVREWGDPDGPELLLVHGQAQCHLCFWPQLASILGQRCRVIAYDMRGHGESGRPPGQASYREPVLFGQDVASVIAATGLRRPVAVGWSMGGRSLREYLILHGDAGLSGINSVASRVVDTPPYSARSTPWLEADLPTKIEAVSHFLRACYHKQPEAERFVVALAYNMLLPFEARAGIASWVPDPAAATRALQHISIPVLVTQGRQDQVVPEAFSRLIADAVPHCQLSLYDDCGHSPFQEHPERFNRELGTFVREAWRG